MPWTVEFHPACEAWVRGLSAGDREALVSALEVLEEDGPTLGRPLVDGIKGSRHANMKELRPPSAGRSKLRVLFAFDPDRSAILLVGGDKRGRWGGWYDRQIPIADARFDEHLAALEARRATRLNDSGSGRQPRGGGRR